VFDATLMRTDRIQADGPASGGGYRNGCAAGFMSGFRESTGSTVTICVGMCSPLKTDNTLVANAVGSPTVLAKLPTATAPAAGEGRCIVNKKGSEAGQNCIFAWIYNIENNMLIDTPYNDTLGVCIGPQHYNYDHDGDAQTANRAFPSCATLPAYNKTTPNPPANCTENPAGSGNFEGPGCLDGLAHQWGCYNVDDSGILGFQSQQAKFVKPAAREWRYRAYGEGEGRRHLIRD
jgi:hypothetical protein